MVRLKNRITGVVILVDEVTADLLGPEWSDPEDVPDVDEEPESGEGEETPDDSGDEQPRKRGRGAHAKTDG